MRDPACVPLSSKYAARCAMIDVLMHEEMERAQSRRAIRSLKAILVVADTQTHLFASECDWSISLIARLLRAYLL